MPVLGPESLPNIQESRPEHPSASAGDSEAVAAILDFALLMKKQAQNMTLSVSPPIMRILLVALNESFLDRWSTLGLK